MRKKLIRLLNTSGYKVNETSRTEELMDALSHQLDLEYVLKSTAVFCKSSSVAKTMKQQKQFKKGLTEMLRLQNLAKKKI